MTLHPKDEFSQSHLGELLRSQGKPDDKRPSASFVIEPSERLRRLKQQ